MEREWSSGREGIRREYPDRVLSELGRIDDYCDELGKRRHIPENLFGIRDAFQTIETLSRFFGFEEIRSISRIDYKLASMEPEAGKDVLRGRTEAVRALARAIRTLCGEI